MRYVVDIDGTICIPGDTEETRYTGATPISERINEINKLYKSGNYIIYMTARGMGRFKNSRILSHKEFYDFTYSQLRGWSCEFHELHFGKPNADCYIDDRGINADLFFSNLL